MWAHFFCNSFNLRHNLLFLRYKSPMKKLILTLISTLFSMTVLANSYCYDDGVFAVSRYKEAVLNCNTNFDHKKFDLLITALIKGNSKSGLKASAALRIALDETLWSSKFTETERACLKPIIREQQSEVDVEVLRSLEMCL